MLIPHHDRNDTTFKSEDGKLLLLNPMTGSYLPVRDVEKELKEVYDNTPRTANELAFHQAFKERRAAMRAAKKSNVPPFVPGGVGHGAFYNSTFHHDFTNGSAIAHDTICPASPGTGVTTDLYLTSTNRTAKGVEALIWYNGNTNPEFWIYDWARTSPSFVFGLSGSQLSKYLSTKTISGASRQYIAIQNETSVLSGNTWINIVWLVNHLTQSWDYVYSYTYTATTSSQKDPYDGSWGPIIETFQNSYSNTNVLGFHTTYLNAANAYNSWTTFDLLRNNQSYMRNDNVGFQQVFLDPNHTFGARAY